MGQSNTEDTDNESFISRSVEYFHKCIQENPEISIAIAAVQTLFEYLRIEKVTTLAGLLDGLKAVKTKLMKAEESSTSVSSGCELFVRFITLASLEQRDFQECKKVLVERGEAFLSKALVARSRISRLGVQFVRDGVRILTHSKSRTVLDLLRAAGEKKVKFTVYVTESMPDKSGYQMQAELMKYDIPTTVILDSAVGYIMERIDLVLVGAEGVVESGGIINKIGTYQLSVMAKTMNKPVYVVVESFKFLRMYPLCQSEVPNSHKYVEFDKGDEEHPSVDYTPPSYITLLLTDLGVLTPSAVSDELIKLYC